MFDRNFVFVFVTSQKIAANLDCQARRLASISRTLTETILADRDIAMNDWKEDATWSANPPMDEKFPLDFLRHCLSFSSSTALTYCNGLISARACHQGFSRQRLSVALFPSTD